MAINQNGATANLPFLKGGGEMGALMRAKDWSKTKAGPIDSWSQSLRTVVQIMLGSRYAMWMGWGSDLTFFYNDAYRATLGAKHPWALGPSAREVWREIWPTIGPRVDHVVQRGEATYDEGLLLFLERHGYPEETYHTFSYSPLQRDDGEVGGMLCVVTEETERVIGERRLRILRELASGIAATRTEPELFEAVRRCLDANQHDVPFHLTYLVGEGNAPALLASSSGIAAGDPIAPPSIDLREPMAVWPIATLLSQQRPVILDDPPAGLTLPRGPWDKPPRQVIILPIAQQGQAQPAGAFIAALNPYRPIDESYRGFLDLIVGQIASGLANARSYEQEHRRAEALAEIDRAKTTFFSNASHEFRTPLTLMLSPLADMLVRAATADALVIDRRDIELIHRNGLRLLKLVNTLLEFSRIEAGRVDASYEAVDLPAYTSELASNFRSAMERAGLTFTVHCPPLAATAFVDRDMWEKIVLNLVSNAFKYTLAGEVAVSLSLTEDKQFLLTVRDTGIGVPAEEVPRLFERFHRVEGQHGRTQEGSGIGLALVNELVRLHGGTVRVDSALGQGSVFTVAIPSGSHHLPRDRIGAAQTLSSTALRAEAFVEEALRWLPDAATASGVSLGEPELSGSGPTTNNATDRPRVLLADDNADMRDYIQRLLAPRYDVIAVPDGQAAVDAARAQAPDLVLSDVMMPRIDGFGVLRALRADPALRDLPIVLLSARAGEEAKVEGLAAGADDYLVKPFSARELLARVDVNLQMSRLRRLSALRERDLRTEAEFMRARFESVLQHLPIAIALADADGKVVLTNPALDRMLRHAAIPTANVADLAKWHAIHTDGRHFAVADYPLARALRGEDVRDVEHLYRRGDGTLAWQLSSGIPIRNADGAVVGALVASLDIDAQKRAEVELRSLNETLEQRVAAEIAQRLKAEEASRQSQKMEAIGQLTGGVAHDFNNLLQVILGNIDTVQRRYANKGPLHRDADFRRLTDAVLRGAERGATLTQQLLAFSRRQPLEPKPIDANKLVSGMSDLIRRTLGERISVETILAGGLWRVSADANQLETALLNLALNARDAMPRGGKLTVETANAFLDDAYAETHDEVEPGQYVLIAMSDTGEGMNAEIIARAFEPFFTTKEIGRGTGLGLSQVYGFVKQSGGHVKIYSEIAEGTTVKLYLPRLISGDATIVGPSETLAPRGERGETILVVEDDPDVRSYSAGLLRELGYAVIEAADGTIALGFLDTLINVDLLFTDVGLPGGVNGRQLADEARRRHPGLKVLFTTGYARNAIVHQGRLDPGVDLIGKPFTFSGLANKVRQMLAETDDR